MPRFYLTLKDGWMEVCNLSKASPRAAHEKKLASIKEKLETKILGSPVGVGFRVCVSLGFLLFGVFRVQGLGIQDAGL